MRLFTLDFPTQSRYIDHFPSYKPPFTMDAPSFSMDFPMDLPWP